MTTAALEEPASGATQRANAFVAEHRAAADALGHRLADLVGEPDAFVAELRAGFESLADAHYRAGQQLVAPGLGPVLGVRVPLLTATARALASGARDVSTTLVLFVVERLLREELLELRWFAFRLAERTIARDPAPTWQLLRHAAREAADWITVDSLAHPMARGIIEEPYRWAEVEQLVFSPSRWERRLVGSTIATMPFVDRQAGRTADYVSRALAVLADLIGDHDPEVQKALAWAYRSVATVDQEAAARALSAEAETAEATDDGHRAWVVRDALGKLDTGTADRLRARLAGIRRKPGGPSTSRAGLAAAAFREGFPAVDNHHPTNVR